MLVVSIIIAFTCEPFPPENQHIKLHVNEHNKFKPATLHQKVPKPEKLSEQKLPVYRKFPPLVLEADRYTKFKK
jgi:hypothetical protein